MEEPQSHTVYQLSEAIAHHTSSHALSAYPASHTSPLHVLPQLNILHHSVHEVHRALHLHAKQWGKGPGLIALGVADDDTDRWHPFTVHPTIYEN